MGKSTSAEEWAARAAACELLALSLRYPDEALHGIVASGEWACAADEIAAALGVALPDDWAEGAASTDFHDLRADATMLFVGAPKAACSPFEGYWRAEDAGVQPLMFVNPHSVAVERFCRACGLGQPEGVNEPLDHVATELELLEYLASVEAGIGEPVPEGPAPGELPGGSAGAAWEEFVRDHLLAFAPRFAARLAADARTAYYRATGRLLGAFAAYATDAADAEGASGAAGGVA
ncbi:MAG: molecular chaperone TorD family protein [Eggerthellaceae bacterium]|nr:molecular chaperone TorD family protein [Eggerthellaceae bacterium]